MRKRAAFILWSIILIGAVDCFAPPAPAGSIKTDVVTITVEQQYEAVRPGGTSALAVRFEMAKDWHFYASPETAVGGMNLKLEPSGPDYISFSQPVFPKAHTYFDKALAQKLDVFSDKFMVFMPFTVGQAQPGQPDPTDAAVEIGITGAVCSDWQCRVPDFGKLGTVVRISRDAPMNEAKFVVPAVVATPSHGPVSPSRWASYSVWAALGLAFLAGLLLNVMPCVWPVLPIIVMRIVEQAKQSKSRSAAMGLAFCVGILLFFACLGGANIILQVFYGTVLQVGDPFRIPWIVGGMALLLVVLALFMFGAFTVTVPSSIAAKSGSGRGYTGALGMGFLAAILSTPCSFGILAAAFAWAQTQPLVLGTLAMMVIGIGMAVPYALLMSMPGLLNRMPRAGRWMEIFKQAVGFVLLFIAVWLITALPQQRRANVLYFALVLSFCVWMWGGWVSFNTGRWRKSVIRSIAVILALLAALMFLVPPVRSETPIDWQPYDAGGIEKARAEGRPVLIKFTADWCLSCKLVERTVYANDEVARLIRQKNVLAIKADTTGAGEKYPATFALKNIYKEPGVPVTMLFLPGKHDAVRWRGKAFSRELKGLLEELPSKPK